MKKWIRQVIFLITNFFTALGFTVGYYTTGLKHSTQYTQGFIVQLIYMHAPDRHSYQIYKIFPD